MVMDMSILAGLKTNDTYYKKYYKNVPIKIYVII